MPRTALILYYTRSRNTARVAGIAEKALVDCGWEVTRMPLARAVEKSTPNTPDLILLGTPVQYWTVPAAAMELIDQLPDFQGSYAFVFSCYGGCVTSNVPYQLGMAMAAKGATVIGGAQFLTPHSCRVNGKLRLGDLDEKFGKGQPDEKTAAEFSDAVCRITQTIESGSAGAVDMKKLKINTMGILSSVMNPVSPLKMKQKFMPPVAVDPYACDGCGACENVCDTGSIRLNENKVAQIDQKTCYRCYGCMEVCPNEALTTNWKQAELLVRSMQWLARDAGNVNHSVIVLPDKGAPT